MDNYIEVNIVDYVKKGLEDGTLVPVQAEKYARIVARQGNVGEEVVSWSVDSSGNEIKEKVDTVQLDPNTNEPGWIVTKATPEGDLVVDDNNHLNQWIIGDSTFRKKYEIDSDNPDLYKPTGGIQMFVQIPDNIILEQWGSKMQIASGGYINITNSNDMYGISERDFDDTYTIVGDPNKKTY